MTAFEPIVAPARPYSGETIWSFAACSLERPGDEMILSFGDFSSRASIYEIPAGRGYSNLPCDRLVSPRRVVVLPPWPPCTVLKQSSAAAKSSDAGGRDGFNFPPRVLYPRIFYQSNNLLTL
jgi:hypothetical protein